MAIDVTNHHIGVALAHHSPQNEEFQHQYHRQNNHSSSSSSSFTSGSSPSSNFQYVESIYNHNQEENLASLFGIQTTTTITPLPPIPYMSHRPYPQSSTSRYSHRLVAGMPTRPPRLAHTLEIAQRLRDLAVEHDVNGVLVRWPGGGSGSGMMTGRAVGFEEELVREMEEGRLLSLQQQQELKEGQRESDDAGNAVDNFDLVGKNSHWRYVDEEGTMGYRRGRVLYFLDKCCMTDKSNSVNTSGKSNNNSNRDVPAFLSDGARSFAFWDSSFHEHKWMHSRIVSQNGIQTRHQQQQQRQHQYHHLTAPIERVDRYGNSLTAVDQWGRAPIFGMPPEDLLLRFRKHREDQAQKKNSQQQQQNDRGSFYYSSKHQFAGYHDGYEEKMIREEGKQKRYERLLDRSACNGRDECLEQYEGSLPAVYSLHEFARMHLRSRILLPCWVMDTMTSHVKTFCTPAMESKDDVEEETDEEFELFGEKHSEDDYRREVPMGYRRTQLPKAHSAASINGRFSHEGQGHGDSIMQQHQPQKQQQQNLSYEQQPNKERKNGLVSLIGVPTRKLRRGSGGRSERPSLVSN